MSYWRGGVSLLALACIVAALGCGSSDAADPSDAQVARVAVQEKLGGVWRLTSYVPDSQLSPALLFSMQADKIVIRFEDGKVKSATPGMTMDRDYRLDAQSGNRFKVFIKDGNGVEYESQCEFDKGGRVLFYTVTAPWRGRGVLEREGPAMSRPIGE